MLRNIAYRPSFLVAGILLAGIFVFSRCIDQTDHRATLQQPDTAVSRDYAGSATCRNCHRQAWEDHQQHFHHLTSTPATDSTVMGDFSERANRFYFNPGLYVSLEKRGERYYQAAWRNGKEQVARPFDIVVGSGKRGQTFLYWHQQYLFQLPISYFTETKEWTNSPGYSNIVQFNRPITARCMECHSTWIQQEEKPGAKADVFAREGMILGVECEKCHGPAKSHADYHQLHPGEKKAHAILSLSSMTRLQQLDQCRLCHGGMLSKTKPSFSFRPGDRLDDFFRKDTNATPVEEIDVHGNQYGMLAASPCFQGSKMTCNSCHHPHRNQSGQSASFTAQCNSCHTGKEQPVCKLSESKPASFLQKECINCHMPEKASKSIMVLRQGETVPTSAHMRSHYIGIYKDISNQILNSSTGIKTHQ